MGRLSLLLAAGCAPSQEGEFGSGTFHYFCVEASDAQCDALDEVAPEVFQALAIGGWFTVAYTDHLIDGYVREDGAPRLEVVSASDPVTGLSTALRLRVLEPGFVALVAYSGSGSPRGENLIHLFATEPTGVRISRVEADASFFGDFAGVSIEARVSGLLRLRAAPIDDDGRILAGALDCHWTTSDAAIVEIASDPTDNVVEIRPVAPGTATLEVTLGGNVASTELVVQP